MQKKYKASSRIILLTLILFQLNFYRSFAKHPNTNVEAKVEKLLKQMTLDEKIGQMTQANRLSIDKNLNEISDYSLGSLLSGGGENPNPNTPENWRNTIERYQQYALKSRLKIPLLYGIDAVHGNNNVKGAVVFPHNIGLGASRDPNLVKKIGQIVAYEVAATGIHWDFAPAVSVPQNLRWGRSYEGFSENTEVVSMLGRAFLEGLQTPLPGHHHPLVLGTGKHFVGDGGTVWGSSHNEWFKIDQGDTPVDEATLRELHLKPYYDLIEAGVQTIMVSYSSWQDTYMHSHKYLITDVLKNEMNFDGLVISDWLGVFVQEGNSFSDKIERSINAGMDMVMAVHQFKPFMATLKHLVNIGRVPMERIDDAVRRILRVKFRLGLFEHPFPAKNQLPEIGNDEHRKIAREAVQKSAVLLKNNDVLPLRGTSKSVIISGAAVDDLGLQCGGWTVEWQGHSGNIIPGTTVLGGLREQLLVGWTLQHLHSSYTFAGNYTDQVDDDVIDDIADYGILVVAEQPYAEGYGDKYAPQLSKADLAILKKLKKAARKTILLIFSGRPLQLGQTVELADGIVAAWLPGTEGAGIADLLYGKVNFTGKLPVSWPKNYYNYNGLPLDPTNVEFPYGFGLQYN